MDPEIKAKNPFPEPMFLESKFDSWHQDNIANIIPKAER